VIDLNVQGTLLLEGSLSANGKPAIISGGGGGGGGSIHVRAGTFAGTGSLFANGGNGLVTGGGGGGGRIAIHCDTNAFTGTTSAAGGGGFNWGGAGSVFSEVNGQPPLIVLDNQGHSGAWSKMPVSGAYDVVVTGGAVLLQMPPAAPSQTFRSLLIGSNSFYCPPTSYYGQVFLTVTATR